MSNGSNGNGIIPLMKRKPRSRFLPKGRDSVHTLLASIAQAESKGLADVVDEMKTDSQFAFAEKVLAANIQAVQVTVSLIEGFDEQRDEAILQRLQKLWENTLPSMAEAIGEGRVAYEKIWAFDPVSMINFIEKLEPLPFRNTELKLSEDGSFEGIKIKTDKHEDAISIFKSWWLALDATALEPHGRSRFMGAPKKEYDDRKQIRYLRSVLLKKYCLRGGVIHGPAEDEIVDDTTLTDLVDAFASELRKLQAGGLLYLPGRRNPETGEYEYDYSEGASILDPAPIDAVLDKSDVRVLRSFGISELSVSQTADVGSFAMAVMHRLVLMSVVQNILSQCAASFSRYVVAPVLAENYDAVDRPTIEVSFPTLNSVPDNLITSLVQSVLTTPALSPLFTSGAVDIVQLLEISGIPLTEGAEAKIKAAYAAVAATAATAAASPPGAPDPGGGLVRKAIGLANGERLPKKFGANLALIEIPEIDPQEAMLADVQEALARVNSEIERELIAQFKGKIDDQFTLRRLLRKRLFLMADAISVARLIGMISPFRPSLADVPAGAKKQTPVKADLALSWKDRYEQKLAEDDEFRFPFVDDAVAFVRKKKIVTADEFSSLTDKDKQDVFTAKGINVKKHLSELKSAVAESLGKGESFNEFKDSLNLKISIQDSDLQTVFRTNSHRAYTEGQDKTLSKPEIKEAFPYVLYAATDDTRVRDHHWALDGFVVKIGTKAHRILKAALADWNCRCALIPLTESEAKRYVIKTYLDFPVDVLKRYAHLAA